MGGWSRGVCVCCSEVGLLLVLAACSDDERPGSRGDAGAGGERSASGNAGTSSNEGSSSTNDAGIVFSGNGHGVPGARAGSWAYLVYMLADNNLESFSGLDLRELMDVGSSDELTILVQIDRATGESSDDVSGLGDFSGAKRLRVDPGQLVELEDLGEVNSGALTTFEDFLLWGIRTAPADHYAVVLWDHGGAWGQFGADTSANNDGLTMHELDSAFGAAILQTGMRGPFDLIGFDACLLGSWEVATALQEHGRYLLASEELEPGHGWNYRALSVLEQGVDAATLGAALIDGFAEQAQEQDTFARITLALSRLDRVPALSSAIANLTTALAAGGMPARAAAVGKSRAEVPTFGSMPTGTSSMVDLLLWASAVARHDPSLQTDVEVLRLALDDVVVDSVWGDAYSPLGGLSVFFPSVNDAYQARYDQLSDVDAWRSFLTGYHDTADIIASPPSFTNDSRRAVVAPRGNGLSVSGTLAADSIASVASTVLDFGLTGIDGTLYVLGENTATLSAAGLVHGEWDRRAMAISQGDLRSQASFLVQPPTADLQTVSIPLLYRHGDTSTIIVLVLSLDAADNVMSRGYYTQTDGNWAAHSAAPGSTLAALIPTLAPGASEVEWVPQATTFDATTQLDAEYVAIEPGANLYLRLRATNYAGQSDSVSASGPL